MSSILKLYLKIFLLFVFCYGTINLIYYFFDTSYFDLKDVYQILIFGFFMSFTLVSLHLFCLKQMKIKDFSSSNLKAELHFEVFNNTSEIVTTIKSQFSDLILDRIKYVHELQNLYFSLTKSELVGL